MQNQENDKMGLGSYNEINDVIQLFLSGLSSISSL